MAAKTVIPDIGDYGHDWGLSGNVRILPKRHPHRFRDAHLESLFDIPLPQPPQSAPPVPLKRGWRFSVTLTRDRVARAWRWIARRVRR